MTTRGTFRGIVLGFTFILPLLTGITVLRPCFSAQARVSAVDPFIAYDDTSFPGDLSPGDKAVVHFEIGEDKTATVKEYCPDTEIRYRDSMDANRISDPMIVRINVRERTGLLRILYNPVLMSVIIAIISGCGYYLVLSKT